jgi:hypothetical protein
MDASRLDVVLVAASMLLLQACAHGLVTSGVPQTGYQADGTYALDVREMGLDCEGLRGEMRAGVARIKALPARLEAERAGPADTLAKFLGRAFADAPPAPATVAEYDRERARLAALNARLVTRECAPLDLAAEIAEPARLIEAARGG